MLLLPKGGEALLSCRSSRLRRPCKAMGLGV
nr:MAG TPA: hypothetical protein [Caudoviricetes sp.]